MDAGYAYVWEYVVPPESAAAFESAYGPDGDWVQLFRRGEGYIRTELLRDLEDAGRFLTIDYWVSKSDCEAFRGRFAAEFAELDGRCAVLTLKETYIGEISFVLSSWCDLPNRDT